MASLEPVSLAALAEALRDLSWLDMRVVGYRHVERVRVVSITINREQDFMQVYQEWPDEEEGVATKTWYVDCEDVMWCRPTVFELADVTMMAENVGAGPRKPDDSFEWWLTKMSVRYTESLTEEQLDEIIAMVYGNGRQKAPTTQPVIDIRHLMLLVMYEITEDTEMDICQGLGYKSVQPMMTARWKAKGDSAAHHKFQARVAKAVKRAEKGGAVLSRRSGSLLPPP